MKEYSKLSLNEQMEMSRSLKDRFITYAKNRINKLITNGTMNERVHALFQGKSESSINSFLENYYVQHNMSYDNLVESFNIFTETVTEQNARLEKVFERYSTEVQQNPFYPLSHKILDEAIKISPKKVLQYLLNEGCNILSNIDVRSQLNKELFESVNAKQACLKIKDDPNYVLGLAESLSRAINYVIPTLKNVEYEKTGIKFLESLNNIYSIYKEGMDIISTQEYQASDLFNLFINDRAPAYHFSIHRLNLQLKDPASFVQYGLRFLNAWVNKHKQRLSYKFQINQFARLDDMFNMYEASHPMLNNKYEYKEEYFYNFAKLYSLLDLLVECSQMLRMDLRNLVCKYISVIRPMIDSYRLDYTRSQIRTGY